MSFPRSRLGARTGCRNGAGHTIAAPGIAASHSALGRDVCHDQWVRPTVLIVDDHDEFRASARALLEAEGFSVVGEAADGIEAMAAVSALAPSVVLLDIQLPGRDGLAIAEQIAAEPDPPAVVLISSRDSTAYGSRLAEIPARGFLAKQELSGAALAAFLY